MTENALFEGVMLTCEVENFCFALSFLYIRTLCLIIRKTKVHAQVVDVLIYHFKKLMEFVVFDSYFEEDHLVWWRIFVVFSFYRIQRLYGRLPINRYPLFDFQCIHPTAKKENTFSGCRLIFMMIQKA